MKECDTKYSKGVLDERKQMNGEREMGKRREERITSY